jgi:hypothetical protein
LFFDGRVGCLGAVRSNLLYYSANAFVNRNMIKAPTAAVRGLVFGAALGLVVGVAIDFLRLKAPVLILGRLALTPSIWVPLFGAVLGLAVGVMTTAMPQPTGR